MRRYSVRGDPEADRLVCEAKTASLNVFACRRDAQKAARSTRKRGNKGRHVHPYPCRTCGKWHIGSAIQARSDRRRAA